MGKSEINVEQNTKNAVHKTQKHRQVEKKTYTHDTDSWRQANRQGMWVRQTFGYSCKNFLFIPQSTINIQIHHFKTTFHILNTIPTYKYIHFKTTFMCPRSRWWLQECLRARRLQASLLLHTTCVCSWCSRRAASCVAAKKTKKKRQHEVYKRGKISVTQ